LKAISGRFERIRYRPFCDIILYCMFPCSANNMNKLSLVGMQLPEKYEENFDVSSEGLQTKGLRSKRRNSPYILHVVASLPTKACSFCDTICLMVF
jgi:hypothetical protein